MKFAGVTIPDELVRAIRDGKVVLFVGAGVSVGEPTGLPLFDELGKRIAAHFGRQELAGNSAWAEVDSLLGRLSDEGRDVHQVAADILNPDSAKPNDLHKILVRLAHAHGLPIVTTNLERQLESAAESIGVRFDRTFVGPALPLGSSLDGLVYLHGRHDRPHEMVLTDADFGRAYLTDGWARRFLVDLFRSYDVLFVGFSHNDTVLKYLARGLPPSSRRRFALTLAGGRGHWESLRVHALEYHAADQHVQLRNALRDLEAFLSRGASEHAIRVREILRRPPRLLVIDEIEELVWIVGEPTLSHLFFRSAAGLDWLDWWFSNQKRIGSPLTDRSKLSKERLTPWVTWLLEEPLSTRGRRVVAMLVRDWLPDPSYPYFIARAAGHRLWQELRRLDREGLSKPEIREAVGEWLSFLSEIPCPGGYSEADILEQLVRLEDLDLMTYWLVVVVGRSPRLEVELAYVSKNSVRLGLSDERRLLGEGFRYLLSDICNKLRADGLATSLRVLRCCEAALTQRYKAQSALFRSSNDLLSFGRKKVETDEQRRTRNRFDFTIDVLRDLLVVIEGHSEEACRSILLEWGGAREALLQRLAIQHWSVSQGTEAAGATQALMANNWLDRNELHREVFRLLKAIFGSQDQEGQAALLDYISGHRRFGGTLWGESLSDDRGVARFIGLLTSLLKVNPDNEDLKERLRRVREDNPLVEAEQHPDFACARGPRERGISPLAREELLRFSLDELLKKVSEARRERRADPWAEPGIEGLLVEVSNAAKEDSDWAIDHLKDLAGASENGYELRRALIQGLGRDSLPTHAFSRVLPILPSSDLNGEDALDVARVLLAGVKNDVGEVGREVLDASLESATALWLKVCSTSASIDQNIEGLDWLNRAINRPGGVLGEYAIFVASHLETGDADVSSLADRSARLHRLVSSMLARDARDPFARIVLSSHLHFWFRIDPDWTKTTLFPLFEWNGDTGVAIQSWQAFLGWGRPKSDLMTDFMPVVAGAWRHADQLGVEAEERLGEMLGYCFFGLPADPLAENGWARKFVSEASRFSRIGFARGQEDLLKGLEISDVAEYWDQRLRRYLDLVLDQASSIDETEWQAVARWSFSLPERLDEAVTRIERHDLAEGTDPFEILYLEDSDRKALLSDADAAARLLAHFLKAAHRPFSYCKKARDFVNQLREAGASEEIIKSLVDRLAELGCY